MGIGIVHAGILICVGVLAVMSIMIDKNNKSKITEYSNENADADNYENTNASESPKTIGKLIDVTEDDAVIIVFKTTDLDVSQEEISRLFEEKATIKKDYYVHGNTTLSYNSNYRSSNNYRLNGRAGEMEFELDEKDQLIWFEWFSFRDPNEILYKETVNYISSFLGQPTSSTDANGEYNTYWDNYKLRYNSGLDIITFKKEKNL